MKTAHLHSLVHKARLDQKVQNTLIEMIDSYAKALLHKGEAVSENFESFFTRYIHFVEESALFAPDFGHVHFAERYPVDYYEFARDFIRPVIDKQGSTVLGKENVQEISNALSRRENVILLANHQTETDPQIISVLLDPIDPSLACSMFFLAGHRVTTDPIAIPFSRGTNIFSIYSKKYIDSPPEEKAEKLKHNTRTLSNISTMLNEGGVCIYVAASNGRDRYDTTTKKPMIAPFDPSSVEMLHLLGKGSSQETHFHLLALSTMDLLPPPPTTSTELGEQRTVGYSKAGLFFGPRLELENLGTSEDRKERRAQRAELLTNDIVSMHEELQNSLQNRSLA